MEVIDGDFRVFVRDGARWPYTGDACAIMDALRDDAIRVPMTEKWFNDDKVEVELTEGEAFILGWQKGRLGGFFSSLADTMARADAENLQRLIGAFPEQGQAMFEWRFGALHQRLTAKGFSL